MAIERFKKSVDNANSLGHRYSRLLHLLWRKSPARAQDITPPASIAPSGPVDPTLIAAEDMNIDFNPLNGFSWRDLDSVGQLIVPTDSDYSDSLMFPDPGFNLAAVTSSSMDAMTDDVYDQLWTGNGAVF